MRRAHLLVLPLLLTLFFTMSIFAQEDDETQDIISVLRGLTVSTDAPAMTEDGLPNLGGLVVTVAVENVYPPFNQINTEGQAEGWDYDVVSEICARLNCQPQFIEADWETMIADVGSGVYDMAANGITYTEERTAIVDFSQPYVVLQQFLVVRANEGRFSTVDEFLADENFTLATFNESTNAYLAFDLLGEDSPRILLEDYSAAQLAFILINSDIDAALVDNIVAQRLVTENPDVLAIIEEPLTEPEELAFIFTLGSDLTTAFDAVLDQMRADGTLEAFNDKWFFGG